MAWNSEDSANGPFGPTIGGCTHAEAVAAWVSEANSSDDDNGQEKAKEGLAMRIVTDSIGNIYTTETYEGKRVQKFVYRGLIPIGQTSSGAPWPEDEIN